AVACVPERRACRLGRAGAGPAQLHALSLHDALPISSETALRPTWLQLQGRSWLSSADAVKVVGNPARSAVLVSAAWSDRSEQFPDRKSTRLNSSHVKISYAVFCLK